MGTVEDPKSISFWERVAYVRIWLLARSRPQFHYAVDVLYQGVLYGTMITLLVLVFNLFGLGYFVDYRLVAHFLGPLGAGALAAGFVRYRIPDSNLQRGWVVAATYGGVAVMVFSLLIEPVAAAAAIGFLVGAVFFMLLHWLYEREARKQQAV